MGGTEGVAQVPILPIVGRVCERVRLVVLSVLSGASVIGALDGTVLCFEPGLGPRGHRDLDGGSGVLPSRRGPPWWRRFTARGRGSLRELPGWHSSSGASIADIEVLGIEN